METFSALLVLREGNSPVTDEFPSQRPVARGSGVFFDLHLNKVLAVTEYRELSSFTTHETTKAVIVTTLHFQGFFSERNEYQSWRRVTSLTFCCPGTTNVLLLRHSDEWTGDSWWRHQMETFSALLALCAGNSPVTGEFPAQKPVTRSYVFFDLRLNKRLSKQSWGWWFETPSPPLWLHCNVMQKS